MQDASDFFVQGYKGTLCGSCDAGYGHSRGLHCSECRNDPEMISLFVATLVILLLLSSFTIASNLKARVPGCSRVNRSSKARKSISSRLRRLRTESATEVPVNFQMVEMLSTGYVPPELINPDLLLTTTSMAEKKADPAGSKANIVEVFKVCYRASVSSSHVVPADYYQFPSSHRRCCVH